jgi:hypothetical protein
MIPSSLARVRPSTQSIDERPVEPEVTADDVDVDVDVDVDEVVDVKVPAGESTVVDARELVEESLVVTAELLNGIISSSSCEVILIPRTQYRLLSQPR